jgi:hypothetical protein
MPLKIGLAAGTLALVIAAFTASSLAEPPGGLLAQALETSAKENGDRLVGETKVGELDDADEVTLILPVDPSKRYKLYGVCDDDCTELSVSARDADGDFIDNSSGQDSDTPVLEIDDFETRTISVEVYMMDCKAEPCAFAVSLAEGPDAARTASHIGALAELLVGGSSGRSNTAEPSADSEEELVRELKTRALDHQVLVGEMESGKRATGEAMRYFYEVDPDAIYTAFALCNCADLNMVARDGDDKTLASDLASDARPIVQVTLDSWPESRRKGRQRLVIEVKMADCGAASCGFAVSLYKSK